MKQDITCVFEGVSGVGGIYISNIKAAQNSNLLNSLQIKAIVTVVRNGKVTHDKSNISDHLYVPADDVESYDISQHFEQTYDFIDKARKKSNILVHCYAGISRSATIVIAYLLKKYSYSLDKVISMVKRRRNKINPNKGFIQQLKNQAAKMGIFTQQKQSNLNANWPSLSIQINKSRILSSSAEKLSKKKNIVQIKKSIERHKTMYNQQSSPMKNKSNQLQKSEYTNKDVNQPCKSPTNDQKYSIEVQNKTTKILKQNLDLTKYMKYINLLSDSKYQRSPTPTSTFSAVLTKQQNTLLPQKLVRIQKLKSKILQSQNRKKSKGKMSQSQTNSIINDVQETAQEQIEITKVKKTQQTSLLLKKFCNQGKGTPTSSIISLHKNIPIKIGNSSKI